MVAQQEALALMMKGKRTKRPRPVSSLAMVADEGEMPSIEWAEESTTEEEDMAHCLILLARGLNPNSNNGSNNNNNNKGVLSYECKTCNKSFPSFQALGGHRASHKKPKLGIIGSGFGPRSGSGSGSDPQSDHDHRINEERIALSLQITNGNTSNSNSSSGSNNRTLLHVLSQDTKNCLSSVRNIKVHECGICGAEFSSGQALGGHMRRHRPIGGPPTITTSSSSNKPIVNDNSNNKDKLDQENTRSFLSLDLNLPAPEDEHNHQQQEGVSNFIFSSKDKTLVFSSPSLVNCHY